MKKILTVVGARPQFIKASVISRLIQRKFKTDFKEILVHSGQHYDENMSEVFFSDLKIKKPKYNLNVIAKSHSVQVARMMIKLEEILILEKPDLVLVYGDTNTTLAAALVSSKIPIPIAHVEAGLRSYRVGMAEEINRVITDNLSEYLFCSSKESYNNLKREGLSDKAYISGDIMLDSFQYTSFNSMQNNVLNTFNIKKDNYILSTIHRAENVENKKLLEEIISALNLLSKTITVLLPIHPRTQNKIVEYKINISNKIKIIEPQPYPNMVNLIHNSKAIITDSGGLQKEAYFAKKLCITFRDETEWVELVENGSNILISPKDLHVRSQEIMPLINNIDIDFPPIFGDGDSGEFILNQIKKMI